MPDLVFHKAVVARAAQDTFGALFSTMPMNQPVPGQRWVSDSEPELGLGIVLKAEFARVELLFPAANEHRQYATKTAPLRRVQFAVGDHIKLHGGESAVVTEIEERAGLLVLQSGAARDHGGRTFGHH